MAYNKAINGKEVIKQLQAQGFSILRINGSHYMLGKGSRRVPAPVHGAKSIKIGTLKSIEKLSVVKLK